MIDQSRCKDPFPPGRIGEPVADSDRVSESATFYDYLIIGGGWALLIVWAVVGIVVGPF